VFYNFVLQELKRYQLACTDSTDFHILLQLFREHLKRRGYAPQLLSRVLLELPPRPSLLQLLINPPPTHTKPTPPILTLNIPRLRPNPNWRMVFRLPQTITTLPEFKSAYGTSTLVIGHQNAPTVATYVTSSTYTSHNSTAY
jgi:hypothetical protein